MSALKRNRHIEKLHASYLFAEIARRRNVVAKWNPDAKLISLGIGDTTEPIPRSIVDAMAQQVEALSTVEGYVGYGSSCGQEPLRRAIASVLYGGMDVRSDDIFVSDGSKCDIARLQLLFDADATVAVQDRSYPAYVDTRVMAGRTDAFDTEKGQYGKIVYLPCPPENDFFPDLSNGTAIPRADIIYFCSPNNPTGVVPTRTQLEQLVPYAKEEGSVVIYDSAYSAFVRDDNLPKSIYEIERTQEVAIETGSFSKFIGFTGVRLGWAVVPIRIKLTL